MYSAASWMHSQNDPNLKGTGCLVTSIFSSSVVQIFGACVCRMACHSGTFGPALQVSCKMLPRQASQLEALSPLALGLCLNEGRRSDRSGCCSTSVLLRVCRPNARSANKRVVYACADMLWKEAAACRADNLKAQYDPASKVGAI